MPVILSTSTYEMPLLYGALCQVLRLGETGPGGRSLRVQGEERPSLGERTAAHRQDSKLRWLQLAQGAGHRKSFPSGNVSLDN